MLNFTRTCAQEKVCKQKLDARPPSLSPELNYTLVQPCNTSLSPPASPCSRISRAKKVWRTGREKKSWKWGTLTGQPWRPHSKHELRTTRPELRDSYKCIIWWNKRFMVGENFSPLLGLFWESGWNKFWMRLVMSEFLFLYLSNSECFSHISKSGK